MATETQIEVSKDPTGLVTRTVTKQAFTWEDASPDCRSSRVTQVDGVVTIVEENFDTMPPVYNLDASTTTEPLESHPKVSQDTPADELEKWMKWKQNPQDSTLDGWTPDTAEGQGILFLFSNWKVGVTTYLAPRVVIKCVTLDSEAPNIANVGIISETGYPGDTGDRNFLLSGLSATQEGANFRVTREYLGSAVGKTWDPEIYS